MHHNILKSLIVIILLSIFFEINLLSQEFTMPSFVHAIDACDMDMDGDQDIIVSCGYEDTIVILFNDGIGNFELNYYGRTTGVAICGCVDDDEIPDIIAGNGQLYYYKNNGDQTLGNGIPVMQFSGTFTLYYLTDVNNDNRNDLIYDLPTYWGVYKNNGNLNFSNIILGSDGGPAEPSLGLLNDDMLPDIIVSYSTIAKSPVAKYLVNNGNFNFSEYILNNFNYTPIISKVDTVFPDDLTLFYCPTNQVHLFENIGNSSFISKGIHYTHSSAGMYFMDRGDYNHDGFDDFSYVMCYWTGCTDSLYVELNDQNWSFHTADQYYIGSLNYFKIRSTDLNNDSYPDFYMTGYNSNNKIKILWNNGDGTFSYLNPVGYKEESFTYSNLLNASPNPFSNVLYISYATSASSKISLKIFDIYGRKVKEIIKSDLLPGIIYTIKWDGDDESNISCPSGVYLINIIEGTSISSTKAIKFNN